MKLKSFLLLFLLSSNLQSILSNYKKIESNNKEDLKSQIENLLNDFKKKQNRNLDIKQNKVNHQDRQRKLKEAKIFISTVQDKLRKLMPQNFEQQDTNGIEDDQFLSSLIEDVGLAMSQNQDEVMVDPKVFHLMIKYLAVLQHLRQNQTHDDDIKILQKNYKKNQQKIASILNQLQEADKELSTIKGYRKKKKINKEEAEEEIANKKQILLEQLKHAQLQENFEKEEENIDKVVKKLEEGEEELSKQKMSASEKLEQVKQLQNEKKKLLKLEEMVRERIKQFQSLEQIEDRLEIIDSKMSDLIQKGINPDEINNLENQKQQLLGVLYKEKEMLQQRRDYYKLLDDQEIFEINDDEKDKKIAEIKLSKEFKDFLKDLDNLSKLEDQDQQKKIIFDSYLMLDTFLKKVEEVQQEFRLWFDTLEQEKKQEDQADEDTQFQNDLKLYGKLIDFSRQMSQKEKKIMKIIKQLYNSWGDFDINTEKATIKFYELEQEYEKIQDYDELSDESEETSIIQQQKLKQFKKQNQKVKDARQSFHLEFDEFINRQGK